MHVFLTFFLWETFLWETPTGHSGSIDFFFQDFRRLPFPPLFEPIKVPLLPKKDPPDASDNGTAKTEKTTRFFRRRLQFPIFHPTSDSFFPPPRFKCVPSNVSSVNVSLSVFCLEPKSSAVAPLLLLISIYI